MTTLNLLVAQTATADTTYSSVAAAHGSNPTAVAAAALVVPKANRAGIPFVIGGHPNIVTTEFTVLAATGAQTNVALVAVSAGTKIVITMASVTCSNANSVNTSARLGFATATLPDAALAGATGILLSHGNIAAGSGVVVGNGAGIVGIGADGSDLRFTCSEPTGGDVRVVVSYYTIES